MLHAAVLEDGRGEARAQHRGVRSRAGDGHLLRPSTRWDEDNGRGHGWAQAGCPWSRPRVFYSSIYLGLRRQGSSAPDDWWATAPRVSGRGRARTGANCLAAGSGLQLPCARAAAAWLGAKMRSWKAVVRVVVRSGGVSGGGVRGSRVALSSLHCATLLLPHASEVPWGRAHRRRLIVLRDGSSGSALEVSGDGGDRTSHLDPTQLLLDAQGAQREGRLAALAAVPGERHSTLGQLWHTHARLRWALRTHV